jgi:hypothetical protein
MSEFYIDDQLAEVLIARRLLRPLYSEKDGERKYKRGADTEADRAVLYREQLRAVFGDDLGAVRELQG